MSNETDIHNGFKEILKPALHTDDFEKYLIIGSKNKAVLRP